MIPIELSPHLIDIYIHSQQIADWENRPEELEEHLSAIEKWWHLHLQTGDPMPTALAYMMLAHMNMLKGYMFIMNYDCDWRNHYRRIFRLKAEITEQFGHANELFERTVLDMEGSE